MSISAKKQKAITAVKDYLVELLEKEDYCEANKIGEMLRRLVIVDNPTYTATEAYRQQLAGLAGLGASR